MRVLYVQYTNPGAYPPLVRGASLLAESGAEVLMLGTRVRDTDALNMRPTRGIEVRLADQPPEGWRLKTHYGRYAAWVAKEAAAWKPDWIYASDLLSAPIALALSTLTRARILYHEHDAPSDERPSWIIKRYLGTRRRLVRDADLVVTPNADRSARLAALGGGREVLTVWNCPRRPARRPPKELMAQAGDVLRVVYRGSVNPERLPLAAIEAVARADMPATLDVVGYETTGSRGYLATLADHAGRMGVGNRVRVLGTISEDELAVICEQCDIGLALMPMASSDENMRHMAGASNKAFEYLSCGVTPLVSDLPDWRRMFVDEGCALACNPTDVESIAAALRWAAGHREVVREMAARGWERLRLDWNYESQFTPVLDAMFDRPAEGAGAGAPAAVEAECAS
jgi:glycosyltransferase involved in cell wall biosynthesis